MSDYSPLFLSIKVALLATVSVFIMGTFFAWFMLRVNFPGKNAVETLIGLPLVLPPTVIGFGLLLIFGKHGPLGLILNDFFGIKLVFTWWAAVIAAIVVALPLMYQSAKSAFETIDTSLEQAARILGSSEWRVFYSITLPLSLPGLMAGVMLSFARSLGEFGATLMFAGNIPGVTQTIPLAIYSASESGDMKTAGYLVMAITIITFSITYGLNKWLRHKRSYSTFKVGERNVGSSDQKTFAGFYFKSKFCIVKRNTWSRRAFWCRKNNTPPVSGGISSP